MNARYNGSHLSSKPDAPAVSTKPRPARAAKKRRGWKFYVLLGVGIPVVVLLVVSIYFYVGFSRMIMWTISSSFSFERTKQFASRARRSW